MHSLVLAKIAPEMLIPFLMGITGVLAFYYIGKGIYLAAKMNGGMPSRSSAANHTASKDDQEKLKKWVEKTSNVLFFMFIALVVTSIAIGIYNTYIK